MTNNRPLKKSIKYLLIIVAICSAVGGIYSFLESKGVFDPKIIKEKYCYFHDSKDTNDEFQSVLASNDPMIAKKINNYYLLLLENQNKDTVIDFAIPDNSFYIPKFIKVKIIGYNLDSSLVQVWVKWKTTVRPFEMEEKGYVPVFTLHDTLP